MNSVNRSERSPSSMFSYILLHITASEKFFTAFPFSTIYTSINVSLFFLPFLWKDFFRRPENCTAANWLDSSQLLLWDMTRELRNRQNSVLSYRAYGRALSTNQRGDGLIEYGDVLRLRIEIFAGRKPCYKWKYLLLNISQKHGRWTEQKFRIERKNRQ